MAKKLMMAKAQSGLQPVTDGLVCWLDGRDGSGNQTTWTDRSGNGNHATVRGEDWLNFSNNKVMVNSTNTNMPNVTKDLAYYTVCCNYKQISTAYWLGILSNHSGTNKGFSVVKTSATDYVLYNVAEYVISNATTLNATDDIVIVYQNSQIYFYVNGSLKSTFNGVLPSDNNTINLFSRKDNSGNDNTFSDRKPSQFNSVKIYNRALTQTEIQQNYTYEQSISRG